ncbi:MAG: hypothetical protein ACK5PP_14150 [Acidimicrobiales bacterium]
MDVGPFVADIQRGDLLIEVQTRGFAAMGRKLDELLDRYQILLVHPIAVTTYLNKPGARQRRSPKRGDLFSLFDELVSVPTLLDHPQLTIEVLMVTVDVYQEADPLLRRGRGGWRTVDRALRSVEARHRFGSMDDVAALLPRSLPDPFTTADLAHQLGTRRDRAQRLAYCLREADRIRAVERTASGVGYRHADRVAPM